MKEVFLLAILIWKATNMMISTACGALRAGKCLKLHYDGYFRTVEVHAVGFTRDGNSIMRVWQVAGGSHSGERIGWKIMRLDEASSAHITEEDSHAPRSGYKRGDSAMESIRCQI